ncbi:hypothetical protein Nepgr_015361 [Nepenthes gracilis]|uniref:RRM domain-containing protein n=1 Tax=Nepenthes gracilis TaxID=150966 RepID=A0AAD3SKY8_NEPGR|nr:hypothetical protein Nepgr_015361 [Nepenthes gracilis]
MDFDEYEYLEKTVENQELPKSKETANGGDQLVKSGDRDRNRSSRYKGQDDDDLDRRSKRPKSGDDSHDNDRHRERGSSRRRSHSRDGERGERQRERHRSGRERGAKDVEREEPNGRERDRNKDKVGDKDRERDHHERREGTREKEKERNRERDRRSRSRSERHPDDWEKSHDRENRERDKERDLSERDKDSRRYKEKKEDTAEPEADPERDQRTVFAYQIALRADERDVYEFFSRAGKVRDVRLIMDRNSRRSKGVGYIEFYDVMSVPMAIALSGQPLLGQPVMVKPSEAEKNLVQSTSTAAGAGGLAGSGGGRKLYVGNLHYNITEDQLRQVFEPFGTVELVQLPLDATGHCKGFGFIQFARFEDAKAAQNLNGQLEIAGRIIKVSIVTDQTATQEAGGNTGDFDDDEGGGLALNARSRALLMQKLDRSGTATSIAGTLGTPVISSSVLAAPPVPILGAPAGVSSLVAPLMQAPVSTLGGLPVAGLSVPPPINISSVHTVGVPSECLLLKNMFDPKLETEPDFDLDIKEDVQGECAKFGPLKHIFVDKNSAGFVYLRFNDTQSAINAQRALHGRWFAGKMITATFMPPQNYEVKFLDSTLDI